MCLYDVHRNKKARLQSVERHKRSMGWKVCFHYYASYEHAINLARNMTSSLFIKTEPPTLLCICFHIFDWTEMKKWTTGYHTYFLYRTCEYKIDFSRTWSDFFSLHIKVLCTKNNTYILKFRLEIGNGTTIKTFVNDVTKYEFWSLCWWIAGISDVIMCMWVHKFHP